MARTYQLVLEFEGDASEDFERVIALEDLLSASLGSDEVDGHDVGQGITNLFLHTDDPRRCFEEVRRVLDGAEPDLSAAAFRSLSGSAYTRLWPVGVSEIFVLR